MNGLFSLKGQNGLTPHRNTMCVSLLLVVVGWVSLGITAIVINTTPAILRWCADKIRQLLGDIDTKALGPTPSCHH